MNDVAYARVVSVFMLAYTLSNGLSGPIIDRLGTKLGYSICMAWWSAAAMLHALARSTLGLGICRFLLGIGEAGNWPAGVKVAAEWFPESERALASGIFNSGSSIGAVLAPPIVAWIVLSFGWPSSFLAVGLTGFVWLVIWRLVYETPGGARSQIAPRPLPAWRLLRTSFVWRFTLSKVFSDPAWYFYIFWFPQYLKSVRHFDLAAVGRYAWIPFLTADLGNLLGGWMSGALLKHGVPAAKARKISVSVFSLLAMSSIPAVLVADVRVSIACVCLATLSYTGALANTLSLPADVFPSNNVGSIWGLASMGAGFGGMVFSLVTGWAVEQFSYVPVFFGFGMLPLVAAAIIWTLPDRVAFSDKL